MKTLLCGPDGLTGRADAVFGSRLIPENIELTLNSLGVKLIRLSPSKGISGETRYHADTLVCCVKPGVWVCDPGVRAEYMNELLISGKTALSNGYPSDCVYNCFVSDGIAYGGKNSDVVIKESVESFTTVAQGYAKCSTVVLGSGRFITSDPSVAAALTNSGKEVLKISNGGIRLNGYSCGFIGGCTGVLANNILAVLGKAELLEDYSAIRDFCAGFGINVISLSEDPPYDYGGLLPVTEVVDYD